MSLSEVIDLLINRLDIVKVPLAPHVSQLGLLAGEISQLKEWKAFGVELGVPQEVLDQINKKHPKNAERAIHGVLKYYTENEKDASYNEVITALRNINELDLASKLSLKLCPPQTHEHDSKSSSSGPKELNVAKEDKVIKSLSYIQEEFAHLVTDLQNALEKEANFTQLKRYIKNYLGDTFRPQNDVTDVDNLFDTLQEHYCFINYDILEVIINKFALILMAKTLKDYKQELNEFLESTEVEYFKTAIVKVTTLELSGISPNQCHVILRLEGKWLEAKVKSLWILLKYIFRKEVSLLTRLKIIEGSVIVQLVAPSSIMVSLITLASSKSEEMFNLGILSIQVGSIFLPSKTSILHKTIDFTFEVGMSLTENPALVECLLQLGADPNYKVHPINTPLIMAIMGNNLGIMCLLMKYNADPNMFNSRQLSAIHIAAMYGSESAVKLLLEAGVSADHHHPESKFTPLMAAGSRDSPKNKAVISLLLHSEAKINFQATDGFSALMYACKTGSKLLADTLLKAGADPNLKAVYNPLKEESATALHLACYHGHEDIVMLLLNNNADPNIKLPGNEATPLMIAVGQQYYRIVKLLLQSGAYVDSKANIKLEETTALHYAASNNDTQLVSLLLNANADVNISNTIGATPMHVACYNGNEENVKQFLKVGAQPNICTKSGQSPLHAAILSTYNNVKIIEKLLNAGADPNLAEINGLTPLHVACSHEKECAEIVQLLLTAKANTDVLHSKGHTPLSVAACKGHSKIVKLLLKSGANTELEKDRRGWTPIFFAVIGGHIEIIEFLLEYGPTLKEEKLKDLQYIAALLHRTKVQQILCQVAKATTSEEKDHISLVDDDTQSLSSILSYFKDTLDSINNHRKTATKDMESLKAALTFKPSHQET